MDMRQQTNTQDHGHKNTQPSIQLPNNPQFQNTRQHASQYEYNLSTMQQKAALSGTNTVGESQISPLDIRHEQREVMRDIREDPRALAWHQYQDSFSPWRQIGPSQPPAYYPEAGQNLQAYQHEYYAREASSINAVPAQVKQEQPLAPLAQDARDLVQPYSPRDQNTRIEESDKKSEIQHTGHNEDKDCDPNIEMHVNGLVPKTEKESNNESQSPGQEKTTDESDGNLRKVRFLSLYKERC